MKDEEIKDLIWLTESLGEDVVYYIDLTTFLGALLVISVLVNAGFIIMGLK